MDEVDEMIRAVDDGDGLLDYGEFVNLIQKHWKNPKIVFSILFNSMCPRDFKDFFNFKI